MAATVVFGGGGGLCPGLWFVFLLAFLGANLLLLHDGYALGVSIWCQALVWLRLLCLIFVFFPTPYPIVVAPVSGPVIPGWRSARFSDLCLTARVLSSFNEAVGVGSCCGLRWAA